ncbi:MAG: RNA polymerase sigma-70 factor [Marinilabiliaceae bacterium]|jgi:RNA polymerase sigma-70 factor (ECF subfamily)|nr:RNA polymerase sigma-70 factor [Marinilabiliaceae bacterium]
MAKGKSLPLYLKYDRDSFERLFKYLYPDLLPFAQAILFDNDEAKDIVQDVFCHIWDRRKSIVINTNIETYLFKSVRNACLNRLSHIKITDEHADRVREAWFFSNNIDPYENEEVLKLIDNISEQFPERMKRVFSLRKDFGLSYEEIAQEMGISINSVKTHLKRAFKQIRESLLSPSASLSIVS